MQESSTVFDHQQPLKSKKRTSTLDGDGRDPRSFGSKDTHWATESFKLPEIKFVRKAARTVRRQTKGKNKLISTM